MNREHDSLRFLTDWFTRHCDGDWEHGSHIRIESLDNPGWALDVSLVGTALDGRVVDWVRSEQDEMRWLHWRSTGDRFEARCGPRELGRALDAFRVFAGPTQRA